jgi:peptide/nickel transport system permease protein
VCGLVVLLGSATLAVLAPLIAPEPNRQILIERLMGPSAQHPFGTDNLGRDLLAQTLWGARISLAVSVSSTLLSIAIGLLIGLATGYFRGALDNVLMRITDVFLSFPIFILMLTAVAVFGSSLSLLIVFLGLSAWPQTARLVRAETLSLTARDFVLSARAVGATDVRIMFVHILPHLVPVLAVAASLRAGAVILIEAGLSYFGLGVPPPTPTWGGIAASGKAYLEQAWWITTIPGVLIVVAVIAYNLMGDGLSQEIDPRRRTR